ncbi:MAG: hypothetical protein WCJ94_06270 [bacterium]
MRKEAQAVFNGLKLIGVAIPKIRKAHPELFIKTGIGKLPEAIFENIKKNNPKLTDESSAFLLYFTGNLVEFVTGDYTNANEDKTEAIANAHEGLQVMEAAIVYLKENKPEIFSEAEAITVPANIMGFITEMKYKISPQAVSFLEQFLGFVSFNLEKGFIQYDPGKKHAPRQMDLF